MLCSTPSTLCSTPSTLCPPRMCWFVRSRRGLPCVRCTGTSARRMAEMAGGSGTLADGQGPPARSTRPPSKPRGSGQREQWNATPDTRVSKKKEQPTTTKPQIRRRQQTIQARHTVDGAYADRHRGPQTTQPIWQLHNRCINCRTSLPPVLCPTLSGSQPPGSLGGTGYQF